MVRYVGGCSRKWSSVSRVKESWTLER